MSALHPEFMETFRSVCGKARVTYRPDYGGLPWVVYINGEAGLHFFRLDRAAAHLKTKGYTLRTK